MPDRTSGDATQTERSLVPRRWRRPREGRCAPVPPNPSTSALDSLLEASSVEPEHVAAAAATEAAATDEEQYGRLGPPIDGRSPFFVAMTATFGVALGVLGVLVVYFSRGMLLLLLLSLFIAAGLDPVVAFFQRRRMSRPVSVVVVIALLLLVSAGIGDLVIPVLVQQITHLVNALPRYFHQLNNSSSFLGRINHRFSVETRIKDALTKSSSSIATGLLGFGRRVLGALTSTLIVIVVSIYLLFDLPRFKRLVYSLTPRSRRARVVLLGDEIFVKVGGYVLGRIVISVISGLGTWVWCLVFGVPYPLLLAVLVAIFGLLPVVGSTIGGLIAAAVALTVSVPIAIATASFYILYRLVEDYVLTPPIMNKTVDVPGLVTVIATLIGAVLLGIIGALIAIPVAAAVKLIVEQVAAPRLERS